MTNTQLMFQPFRKYADFSGRARRKEYWLWILFTLFYGILSGIVDFVIFGEEDIGPAGVLLIFSIVIPSLAVAVRRLHDLDKSGWWVLLAFVPVISLIFLIYFCKKGTSGVNQFGDDPLSDDEGTDTNIEHSVSEDTLIVKLKEIEEMYDKSLITDEERKRMRDKALNL